MDIVQDFYDRMASSYDMLFKDWTVETRDQARILDGMLENWDLKENPTFWTAPAELEHRPSDLRSWAIM